MAEQPSDLVLVYLRRIDEKVDRLIDDVRELKGRMAAVEENLAGVLDGSITSNSESTGSSLGSTLPKSIAEITA